MDSLTTHSLTVRACVRLCVRESVHERLYLRERVQALFPNVSNMLAPTYRH